MNLLEKINIKNRIIMFSVLAIILVLMLLVGNTYSIFVSSNVDENLNVYTTGNLDITYTLSEDNVNFVDITPTSIEDSIKIKPYRITVNNAGTVPYMFDLILKDTTSTDVIDPEYIMVQVGKLDSISLASTTNNVIKEDIIVPAGESVVVDVRVWLSDTVQNTEIGKSFYAKLELTGLAIYDNSEDIDNSVLIANRLLSEMEVGSYVAYTGNNGCSGDACRGVNANSSESSNGYCYDASYQYNSNGWKIVYTDNGSAHIVSAGSPECMCTNSDGTISNSSCSSYLEVANILKHSENLDNLSLKYCNKDYAYLGMCNVSTVWSIDNDDFNKILGNKLSSCWQVNSNSCGVDNNLIDTGGIYWFANPFSMESTSLFTWDYVSFVNSSYSRSLLGIRPVIKLDSTVVVTGGTGTEDDPYIIENVVPNSLKAFNGDDDTSYFHNEAYRTKIKNISFVDYIDTSEAVANWDMSRSNNESIIAWVTNNETSGYYDLYIGSNEMIKGTSLAYYFSNMTNVDSISFDNLDTTLTRDMSWLFFRTGYDNTTFTLDLGDKFDTSKVEDMSYMFYDTGFSSTVFTLDLGDKFDTSSVVNMLYMFGFTGYSSNVFTLDLGDKFDTSNVVNMNYMFNRTGVTSSVFTLDLGDKFDTSNVVEMYYMFGRTGYNSTVFTLDLGDKFDTSKVTTMGYMFSEIGVNASNFTLDLGNRFNTLNVVDMSFMFYKTGYINTGFTLDLGSKFDTSNVENMNRMFAECGYNSTVLTLSLGNKFNTSKVVDMSHMFFLTGYKSTVFTLDLGELFDTSKVTDMTALFYACGYSSTIFTLDLGDKFDTSKVTDMTAIFYQTGYANDNLELDLSMFTFDSVTSYTNMFYNFKTTQKIYVKNTSDQTWIVSKGFTNVTTSNVIVKS